MGGSVSKKKSLINVKCVKSTESAEASHSTEGVTVNESKVKNIGVQKTSGNNITDLIQGSPKTGTDIINREPLPPKNKSKRNGATERKETRFVFTSDFPYTIAKLIHPSRRQNKKENGERQTLTPANQDTNREMLSGSAPNQKSSDGYQSVNNRHFQRLNVYSQNLDSRSRKRTLDSQYHNQSMDTEHRYQISVRNNACNLGREMARGQSISKPTHHQIGIFDSKSDNGYQRSESNYYNIEQPRSESNYYNMEQPRSESNYYNMEQPRSESNYYNMEQPRSGSNYYNMEQTRSESFYYNMEQPKSESNHYNMEQPLQSVLEPRILSDTYPSSIYRLGNTVPRGQSAHPSVCRKMYIYNQPDKGTTILQQKIRGMEDIRDFLQRSNRVLLERSKCRSNLSRLEEEREETANFSSGNNYNHSKDK